MSDNFVPGIFFGFIWIILVYIGSKVYGEIGLWVSNLSMCAIYTILRFYMLKKSRLGGQGKDINTNGSNKSKDYLEQ